MTGWYSSSWKARSLEYGEGGGFPPPFSYATKQSGGDKTHRPPDTASRLRPTKQPVCFTTERAVCDNNHKLKRTCAIVLAVVLTVTFIGHQFATSIWGPYSIMEGTTFEDYDSFIEYMEQDVPANPSYNASLKESAAVPAPEEQIGTPTYYDEYGNEISEEEALKSRLKDKNGNVVCEYISRRSVVSLRYTPKDGTILPITVCTEEDLQEARQVAAVRHVIFGAAYCIECLAVVLVYFKKRAK